MITDTRPGFASTSRSPFAGDAIADDTVVYDYIFTGAGCAGLSLLVHLHQAGLLEGKRVLVIDQDKKQGNDRTWCFWEREAGPFESIVHRSWRQLSFYSDWFSSPLQIAPYEYKLIRGADFYHHCFTLLGSLPEIQWLRAPVDAVTGEADKGLVSAAGKQYQGRFVFNSIIPRISALKSHQYWLLQHFKGWIVETDTDCFDPDNATLMDFRVGQEHGSTFVYVLPFSRRKALVEYTLFSKNLLDPDAYDQALAGYLQQFLGISNYRVSDTEFGVIPMTNYSFPERSGAVLHIGTAGGHTKASSGYTFRFIQKHAARVVDSLKRHGHPFAAGGAGARYHFYDAILLHILHHDQLPGALIFSRLFERNPASRVLRFLDNETSLPEELRLIYTVPTYMFTKAALEFFWARARGGGS